MTGTFLQPDHETQSGSVYKAAIDNSFAVLSRIGQMFAPHEQDTPNMTVRLDAGALLANVTLSEIAAQNTGTITAPTGSDHRIDRVVIDASTGAVSVITGDPGALPRAAPAIAAGKLPVCQVALAHGMTVITNDLITDERVLGGGSESFPVNGIYFNTGVDPATELGYGTWMLFPVTNPLSFYPVAQSATYVKVTNYYGEYYPYNVTDPSKPLAGTATLNTWRSDVPDSQRFHIDFGVAVKINRIYFENYHDSGANTEHGAKNFTFWGSNTGSGTFDDLVYANNEGWTQLTCNITQMPEHSAADASDPQYINVTNINAYRYYGFKFADNWGGATLSLRRLVLQAMATSWIRTA